MCVCTVAIDMTVQKKCRSEQHFTITSLVIHGVLTVDRCKVTAVLTVMPCGLEQAYWFCLDHHDRFFELIDFNNFRLFYVMCGVCGRLMKTTSRISLT